MSSRLINSFYFWVTFLVFVVFAFKFNNLLANEGISNIDNSLIYHYSTKNKSWQPLSIKTPLKNSFETYVNYAIDPIKFYLTPSTQKVELNKEFEIIITADYFELHPSLAFQFENSNTFSIKLLLPDGFVQTGGDYYDFISFKLNKANPQVHIKLKGYFSQTSRNPCFTLLRGKWQATANDYFVRRAEYCVAELKNTLPEPSFTTAIVLHEPQGTKQAATLGTYVDISSEYNFVCSSTNDISLEIKGNVKNITSSGFFVKSLVLHTASGTCGQANNNFILDVNFLLGSNEIRSFTLRIPYNAINRNLLANGVHFDLLIDTFTQCLESESMSFNFPKAILEPSPSSFCGSNNVTLKANGCGKYGYLWTANSTILSERSAILNYTAQFDTQIQVVCDLDECVNWVDDSKIITIKPIPQTPTINIISGSSPFNIGSSFVLETTCKVGESSTWYQNGSLITSGNNRLNVIPTNTSNYQTTCTLNNCPSSLSAGLSVCMRLTRPTINVSSARININEFGTITVVGCPAGVQNWVKIDANSTAVAINGPDPQFVRNIAPGIMEYKVSAMVSTAYQASCRASGNQCESDLSEITSNTILHVCQISPPVLNTTTSSPIINLTK